MRQSFLVIVGLISFWMLAACSQQEAPATQVANVSEAAAEAPTLLPSNTPLPAATDLPTLQPSLTPSPTLEVDLTQQAIDALPVLTIEPIVETDLNSPVTMNLPDDWIVDYEMATIPMPFEEGMNLMPFSAYHGPVSGGTGYIIYLWGFSNVMPAFPLEGNPTPEINLWADGYRMLVTFVLQTDCRVGRDPERSFTVGEYEAVGGFFWAVDCGKMFANDDIPESPDVQGWFAVFQEQGVNFAFYAYVEPRESIAGPARQELQAILDTASIDFSRVVPEEED